jgi:hypothetical protein
VFFADWSIPGARPWRDPSETCRVPLQSASRRSPAVAILGARQVGKSTLARLTFPDWPLLDLENPRDEERISADPLFALSQHGRVVIDEAQRVPELFPVLSAHLDTNSRRRVVLLGSASPHLVRAISESLAGSAEA